jgi:DNA-binding transcriptional MocR family regulator
MASTIIAQLLANGAFQSHLIEVLQPAYARRYHVMMSAIHKHLLPLGVVLPYSSEVVGGYFIWVRLPSPLRASDIVQLAQEKQKLRVAAGKIFQIPGDSVDRGNDFHDFLRLCFAWSAEDQLAEGVRRLGCVIHDALVGPTAIST